MACVVFTLFFKIFLVIFFRAIELLSGTNLGNDGAYVFSALFASVLFCLSELLLFVRMIEDCTAVLRTEIGSLAIHSCRIVMFKEHF